MNLFIIITSCKQITSWLSKSDLDLWISYISLQSDLLTLSTNSYEVHGKWYVKEQYSYKQLKVEIIYVIWLFKGTLSSSIFCSIEKM
jgi:hypothetical protein